MTQADVHLTESVRLIQVSLYYPPEVGTPYNDLCGEAPPE